MSRYDVPVPGEPSYVKHGKPWQQRLLRKSHGEKWLAQHRKSLYPLYVRFGDLPEGGRSSKYLVPPSHEYADFFDHILYPTFGSHEVAVSCFRARKNEDGSYEVDVSGGPGTCATFHSFKIRPAYLLTGTEIGRGMDYEPLLKEPMAVPLPPSTHFYPSHDYLNIPEGVVIFKKVLKLFDSR